MLGARGLQRLKAAFHLPRSAAPRSLTSAQVPQREDAAAPVTVEAPSREAQKGCVLCGVSVEFKNIQLLSQFISPHTGRIYGRHITGLCGKKQKEVSKAIKKAHSLGFMSVTHKHPQFMKDPRICGIKHLD